MFVGPTAPRLHVATLAKVTGYVRRFVAATSTRAHNLTPLANISSIISYDTFALLGVAASFGETGLVLRAVGSLVVDFDLLHVSVFSSVPRKGTRLIEASCVDTSA